MFSKSKINDPIETRSDSANEKPNFAEKKPLPTSQTTAATPSAPPAAPPGKTKPSVISPDLRVIGNLETDGDLHIDGTIEGDVLANVLVIGNAAVVRGEIRADDVVVHGQVIGRIRAMKLRLAESARVEGDILHASIAIDAGAHFEGSVHRADDPLERNDQPAKKASGSVTELTATTISSAAARAAEAASHEK